MRAKKFAKPAARRTALTATLVRFVGQPRFDRLRDHPLFHPFAARKAIPAPDEATARVLRQALAQTARRRDTDRLIRIVID